MSKKFQCPKCPRILTRKEYLIGHLRKKYPCDLVCEKCAHKSPDMKSYKDHIKKEKEKDDEQKEKQEIVITSR